MRTALFFARRYLFSKKSVNAINIISTISVVGVLVSSASLVIVLSFYNGMEKLILSLYSNFAPELRIEPTIGKTFSPDNKFFTELRKNSKIESYTETLEEKVLIEYNNYQFIAKIKGVEPESLNPIERSSILYAGDTDILIDGEPYAILGAQVQSNLRIPIHGPNNRIKLFTPRKGATGTSINPLDEVNTRYISPRAVLQYEPGFDDLIITPLEFAKDLINEHTNISAIEIYTKENTKIQSLKNEIEKELGTDYLVKNREQQNPMLYKTVRSEKWVVFFILTVIGIIAIFNIIGSLTMLVIDKKQDMLTLTSLGANNELIQRIFFYEGLMIAFFGSIAGIFLGLTFCLIQQSFGIIKPNDGIVAIMETYPVDIRATDFILVFFTVMTVSALVSYVASKLSVKQITTRTIN
ncbi:FtsX-like permease family protein [Sphingobacterium sp. UT-1RO-CII-1]|uniref:FtsX-like permease family protein n=1 Tax=Sphingobacterium sp. UT-1RO-CII-1 TaxID=2995225 RepID=UPI00227D27ED|nr:FtsX-like permease family protein [Sphingobacterium sp. UT-1RO-CII-1]MCY4780939.1 FtsX-like permease family protein [Sphingobacterium sp. UT-1RO-CII-1]